MFKKCSRGYQKILIFYYLHFSSLVLRKEVFQGNLREKQNISCQLAKQLVFCQFIFHHGRCHCPFQGLCLWVKFQASKSLAQYYFSWKIRVVLKLPDGNLKFQRSFLYSPLILSNFGTSGARDWIGLWKASCLLRSQFHLRSNYAVTISWDCSSNEIGSPARCKVQI
jgi:hypothetical protein